MTTTTRAALLERLVIDGGLQAGHDLEYLEDHEARDWLAGSPRMAAQLPVLDALEDGAGDLPQETRKRLNTLLLRTLGPMLADDLLELRDLIRSTLIDGAKAQIQDAINESVDFARVAHQRAADVETRTFGEVLDDAQAALRAQR